VTKAGYSGTQPSTLFAAGHDVFEDKSKPKSKPEPDNATRARKPGQSPELTGQIGNKLRSVYNEVLSQPVPDRFLDLLKELDVAVAQKAAK
jgi:hypothetical protein